VRLADGLPNWPTDAAAGTAGLGLDPLKGGIGIAHRFIWRLRGLSNPPLTTAASRCAPTLPAAILNGAQRMAYNLTAAAAATGMNKTSVLSAINAGKISASLNAHNELEIDPAELHRVYPEREDSTGKQRTPAQELMEALQRATVAETELLLLRSIIEDLRRDWEYLKQQAQRLALPQPAPKQTWRQWLRLTG
jgi:hypothetical protein